MGKQLRNLEVVKTPEYMLEAQKLTYEILAQFNTEFNNATRAKYITSQYRIEDGQIIYGEANIFLKGWFLGYLANPKTIEEMKFLETADCTEKDGKITAAFTVEFGLYEADFYPSDSDYSIPFIFETEQDFERQLLAVLEIDPTAQ